jgi:hypothetical protein
MAVNPWAAIPGGNPFAGSSASSLLSGLSSLGSDVTSASFWKRVVEVLLGIVILAVGMAKLTDAVPAATKLAKAVS